MASVKSGDVIINSCTMASSRGSTDFTNDIIKSVVYESIYTPNCIAEITVLDTQDVLGNLVISGDETVIYSFNAPGAPVATYTMGLDKIVIEPYDGSEKSKLYTLHCVGKETFNSMSTYVQKSYNTDIASIVQDIHNTFLQSTSNLITEATQGIQKIIIPNLKPFEAIDMIRRRATSLTNQSSTFLYFENFLGHNFKTIEGMMQQSTVKDFIHSDALGSSIFFNNYNQIINYQVPQLMASTQRIDLGTMVQRTAQYDTRTRSYTTTDQQINPGVFANPGSWNSSLFKEVYGQGFNVFSFLPFDSHTRPDTGLPASSPLQLAYIGNLMQSTITLEVYGDATVKAGDLISAAIPESVDSTGIRNNDPMISGNYLVANIARHIGRINESPRYTETIEGINGAPPTSPS